MTVPPPPDGAAPALVASETRYRTLLRNLPDSAVFMFDAEMRFLVAEGPALAAAGVDPSRIVGHRPWHVLGAEGAALVVPHYRAALAGEERRFFYPFAGRVYASHAVPVRDAGGAVTGGLMVARDVTTSVRQERALEEALVAARTNEVRLRAVFDAMPGSMAIIDPETAGFLTFNDAACERLGYTREEFARLTVADIDASHDREGVFALVRRSVASDERLQFRTRHRTRTGQLLDVLVTSLAFVDDGRRVACCTWMDIGEQVRAEERLALALESAEDGLWDWNIRDGTAYVSPRWAGILGYAREELPATLDVWASRLHPEDAARVWGLLDAHLRGETPQYACEQRLLHRDGSYVWVMAKGKVVERAPDGAPVRAVGTLVDITARKVAEEARRATEALLRTVIAAAPVALLVTDRDGVVSLLEGGALPVLGWRPGELVGQSLFEAIGAIPSRERSGRMTTVGEIVRRALAGETVESMTELPDDVTFSNVSVPLRDPEGAVTGFVGLSFDVSERQRLEAQLRQAQKMEAVGQLAGGIAHDFNNLLTVIAGNVEFMRGDLPSGGPNEGAVRAELAEIADATERARNLVRQLLTFSRKQPIATRRVRLGELVTGAQQLLRRVIGEEIRLVVRVEDEQAATVADPGQLEQVLMNLAVNARDAMLTPLHGHPGNGGTLTVEVARVVLDPATAASWEGASPGPWVRLRVRDTGHGMDAPTRAHIFEPFFTTKKVGTGTGLGLATVFGIVRRFGGAVRADSAPGAGTTFTILFPPADAEAPDAGAGAAEGEPVPAEAGATVLLVEDEAGVRAAARRMLERRGYAVLEARDGREALHLWGDSSRRVDAVVTDVRMPEMGGLELVARLEEVRPGLPVVFMTGYADQRIPLDAGGTRVMIDKPFTADALLAALAGVLEASRA